MSRIPTRPGHIPAALLHEFYENYCDVDCIEVYATAKQMLKFIELVAHYAKHDGWKKHRNHIKTQFQLHEARTGKKLPQSFKDKI